MKGLSPSRMVTGQSWRTAATRPVAGAASASCVGPRCTQGGVIFREVLDSQPFPVAGHGRGVRGRRGGWPRRLEAASVPAALLPRASARRGPPRAYPPSPHLLGLLPRAPSRRPPPWRCTPCGRSRRPRLAAAGSPADRAARRYAAARRPCRHRARRTRRASPGPGRPCWRARRGGAAGRPRPRPQRSRAPTTAPRAVAARLTPSLSNQGSPRMRTPGRPQPCTRVSRRVPQAGQR